MHYSLSFVLKKVTISGASIFILIALFLFPSLLYAASVSLSGSDASLPVGQTVQIDMRINTQDESVNAVGATIQFPPKLIEFESVRDGSSLINFWVEPAYLSTDNSVSFSGITPGGFTVGQGTVISLLFRTKAEGTAEFLLKDLQVLRNDGEGTLIPVSGDSLSLSISASAPDSSIAIPVDVIAPEDFSITRSRSQNIFGNKWFIVFATQDKDSGIHHYEVAERRGGLVNVNPNDTRLEWREVTSPYVLKDQSLKSGVYVRAIDRAGNDRVARLAPEVSLQWYENYQFWGILIGIVCVLCALGISVWKIKKKRS